MRIAATKRMVEPSRLRRGYALLPSQQGLGHPGGLEDADVAERRAQPEEGSRRQSAHRDRASGGGGQHQPIDQARVTARQLLGHHATERVAHHRGGRGVEGEQDAGNLVGELCHVVASPDPVRLPVIAQIGDDQPAFDGELLDEPEVRHLAVEAPPVDQDDRRGVLGTHLPHEELLVADEDRTPRYPYRADLRAGEPGGRVGPEQPPPDPAGNRQPGDPHRPHRTASTWKAWSTTGSPQRTGEGGERRRPDLARLRVDPVHRRKLAAVTCPGG